MKLLQRFLREPLLHFLAIGGLIFVLYTVVSGPAPAPVNTIVIGPEHIERLAKGFQAVWRHPPSADELDGIIEDAVREEVYYREALALGLDKNDTIVRRRLRQKMEFLADTGASLLKPAAGELEDYFAANKQTYRSVPKLAFEQIYLGEQAPAQSATQLLASLKADTTIDPSTLGERTLLPAQLDLSHPNAIDGVFGKGFFEQLAKLRSGVWSGPVTSSYGVHLARILESVPAAMPPLEDVRDAVLRDWKAAKAKEIREQDYARRRARFIIEIRRRETKKAESQ